MAEIRVDAERWEALSAKHREMVLKVLIEEGILQHGDVIVGDVGLAALLYPGTRPAIARDTTNACVEACWQAAEMAYAVCVQHGGSHFVCSQAMEMQFKFCVAEMCPEAMK